MYPKIRLSRLELIENHHRFMNDCPFFVLMFLANSLAIKYNPLKNSVDDLVYTIQKVSRLQPYLEENDLTGIAGFINPHCEWDKESLLLAFKDAYNFTPQIPMLPQRKFNRKTPDEPLTIDEFMTFQICIRYRIPTSRDTTFEDCKIRIAEWSTRMTPLRQTIFQRLYHFSRQQLIDINSTITSNLLENSERFDTTVDKIAKRYRLDASDSDAPEEELALLERSENDFLPISLAWRSKYLVNPSYYQLDSRYIPRYEELYSEKTKAHLIYLSGADLPKEGGSEAGTVTGSTLVIGIDPRIDLSSQNMSSIMKTPIPSCQTERLRHFISSSKYVYVDIDPVTQREYEEALIVTREELMDHFNAKGNFTIPTNVASEFTNTDLSMIIRNSVGHELVDVINNLKKSRQKIISDAIGCMNLLRGTDVPVKLMKSIENIGFVMRGWETAFTKPEELPVKYTYYEGDDLQVQVEDKTIEKIVELLKDPRISIILSRMPLLKIRYRGNNTSDRFISTYGKDVSVRDRLLNIITEPNGNEMCIRDNSNMLLTTSHFFMTETGLATPMFNLDDLNHIQ